MSSDAKDREAQIGRIRSLVNGSEGLAEIAFEVEAESLALSEVELQILSELTLRMSSVFEQIDLPDSGGRHVYKSHVVRKGLFGREKREWVGHRVRLLYALTGRVGWSTSGKATARSVLYGIGFTEEGELVAINRSESSTYYPPKADSVRRFKRSSEGREFYGPVDSAEVDLSWSRKNQGHEVTLALLRDWGIEPAKLLSVGEEALGAAVREIDEQHQRNQERADRLGIEL